MKRKIIISIVVLLLEILHEGAAQNNDIRFTPINGVNGNPIGKIRNITQDPHGYMWFSGEDEKCIYRYDGSRIIAFRHDNANPNSLGGVVVNSVYADNSGMIWIGLGEGLDQYDPATGVFKHYRNSLNDPGSLSRGGVTPVLKDRQGRLWVGTNNGLDRLDEKTGKFIHYKNDPGNPKSLSDNVVWNIYEDRQGVIWIATGFPFLETDPDAGGLNRLNSDGTFTRFMHDPKDPNSLVSNKVRAMFEDSRGVFWVGTKGDGLHTMDRKTGRFERHLYSPNKPDQLSRPPRKKEEFAFNNDQVTFIIEDVAGSIWIGSMWSGINRYDTLTKKITHYEGSHGFPDSSAWNAFLSRDGMLWLSTQQNNLFRAGPFPRTINNMNQGMRTTSFLEDKEGYLWTGTDEMGLLQHDKQKRLVQHFRSTPSKQDSLFDSSIICLVQSQKDTIWMGTGEGVGIFNTKTKKFSSFPLGFKFKNREGSRIFNIFHDSQGLIWFATGEGLVRYNSKDGSIKRFQPDEKDSATIGSNRIICFLEDSTGEFWIGVLGGGINRLNRQTDKFTHYLPGFNGICMYQDKDGTIWAGTNNGLYRYSKSEDKFLPFFDSQSEFSREFIFGFAEDNSKNLWITTPSAIIKLSPERNETFVYASKFGIAKNSISPNAIYKTRKGELLIGHYNGFYAFLPDELDISTSVSKIIITDFFINTLPVLPGKGSPIQKPVEEISDLDLKYDQNNIAFNFAAIDYQEPEGIKYFTMLEGYDNIWREAKGEKSSYYFNIPRGKYVYRVKAFNRDGTKAEKVIAIRFNPPWWETWWAYTLYALLFIITIWTFIKWRTRALKREKILLEQKVAERTRELKEEKEVVETTLSELKSTQAQLIQSEKMASLGELTAGIAHEIQNPLNFVNNFSEVNKELIDEMEQEIDKGNFNDVKEIAKDIRDNQEKINHHGKRADAIVKGMLQHSRTSSGQKEPTDINALADEYFRLAYHGLRAKDKTFNATIKTDFDESIGKINIIPQDIGRVILNLITNAFYAAPLHSPDRIGTGTGGVSDPDYKHSPTVWVSTKKVGDNVLISVKDNGPGIPLKILDKIFQPFFTTKPTGQGTGLGLSLSYDIVKAHGGEINVKTEENKGSEFIIQLPL